MREMKGVYMKKTGLYYFVIASVLIIISLISLNHGKAGIQRLFGYTAACDSQFGPQMVSGMEGGSVTCSTVGPPTDAYNDILAWVPGGVFFAPPVVDPMVQSATIPDVSSPTAGAAGPGYMRVKWKSANQFVTFPGTMFENQGTCPGGVRDWSCYDYIGYNVYLNWTINQKFELVPHTISFYDGSFSVTTTANPVNVNWDTDGVWKQHVTVSLKWLANQYNVATQQYFNVANIVSVSIGAPQGIDYSTYDVYSGLVPGNDDTMVAYYDSLKLGNGLNEYPAPNQYAPASVTIQSVNVGALHGSFVRWDPLPIGSYVNNITPTAYEIYRSVTYTANGYVYAGKVTVQDIYAPLGMTDTACEGGDVFCYKILPGIYGPSQATFTAQANTVNASYHEDLLANVTPICGWVDAIPPTPTVTPTYDPSAPVGTPTSTRTSTPTVTPTVNNDISQAHVYPNPFNPNAGSGKFYVNNVMDGTKVFIYSMDGSLVKDGEVTGTYGTFVWDGKNKNGSKVVSGLYYIVLQDNEGKNEVKRLIICYKCDPVYKP